MKVIHEKDYVFDGIDGDWYRFISNPKKVSFDPEILHVKRARFVLENGGYIFYDYFNFEGAPLISVRAASN